jgi:hypothetical protein
MNQQRYVFVALAKALVSLSLAMIGGCDGSSGRVPVTGTVTLDGQPVEGGGIVFLPPGDGGTSRPKAVARIDEGKYTIPAALGPVPGPYRVEIRWQKKTGKKIPTGDPPEMIDETRQVIPDKYNAKSILTADVRSGVNTFPFDLKSK